MACPHGGVTEDVAVGVAVDVAVTVKVPVGDAVEVTVMVRVSVVVPVVLGVTLGVASWVVALTRAAKLVFPDPPIEVKAPPAKTSWLDQIRKTAALTGDGSGFQA